MQTFQPNLDLLRQTFGATLLDFEAESIKTTFPWSLVYRVTLHRWGLSMHESIVLKAIYPGGPTDPREGQREFLFYQSLYGLLLQPKPRLYSLALDEESGWYVIILEDLSATHRIPKHPHQWSRHELQSVLHAYAVLHASSILPLAMDREWLNPRHETQLDFDLISEQVATVQRAGIWGPLPELSDLVACARISCQKYAGADVSLLHSDTTPVNAALPIDAASEPAVLIDWQDAGLGMPEMDLAYMDLQPFGSARLIPRAELLSRYWSFRRGLAGDIPSPAERAARQRHADLVMALWLTRPASRVALHPYPEGTYPRLHWDSHFGIIYDRLQELAREIKSSR